MNVSAPLTTLMVVTNKLSSYLLILSLISVDLLLFPSYCSLHVSAIFSFLLFPDFALPPLMFQLAPYRLAIAPKLAQGCASPCI